MRQLIIPILTLLLHFSSAGQQHHLPEIIDPKGYYLFYLHGGVVTVKGDNAINDPVPQYGPYQYSRILDTLGAHGFNIISERRFPNVDDSIYAMKIKRQVDSLFTAKVPVSNIIFVGASAGSNIVLLVSDLLKNREMQFVIMGGCSSDIYQYYLKLDIEGNFLSIIESSDSNGTCGKIFENRARVNYREVTLKTGLDHGFIYKPFASWVNPIVQWFGIFAKDYRARKAMLVDRQ